MLRLKRWLVSQQLAPLATWAVSPTALDFIARHRMAPPLACEVDAAPVERQALFDRVAAEWTMLGEIEPHWSVLADPRYRAEVFPKHEEAFYEPHASGAAVVKAIFARNGETLSALTDCLELGCGVGRATASLARLIPRVAAVDISPGHLALARDRVVRAGLDNVSFHQVRSVADFATLPRFDLLFSELVLQHNPPPIIAAVLERLFARLAPGGYCLFQLPTYRDNYRFEVKSYLARNRAPNRGDLTRSIEMHVLPQPVVHRLMREAGIELIEVVEDGLAGHPTFQSMTFFGRKARSDVTRPDSP